MKFPTGPLFNKMSYMAQVYMRRANEGFLNANRLRESPLPSSYSQGYLSKSYNPITENYGAKRQHKYAGNSIDSKCYIC